MQDKLFAGEFITNENVTLEYEFFCKEDEYNECSALFSIIKENYSNMQDKVVDELFSWQENRKFKFMLWKEQTCELEPIHFKSLEEILLYLGDILVNIISYKGKKYIGFSYYKNCMISTVGLSAVFDKTELINVDATDSQTNLENFMWGK